MFNHFNVCACVQCARFYVVVDGKLSLCLGSALWLFCFIMTRFICEDEKRKERKEKKTKLVIMLLPVIDDFVRTIPMFSSIHFKLIHINLSLFFFSYRFEHIHSHEGDVSVGFRGYSEIRNETNGLWSNLQCNVVTKESANDNGWLVGWCMCGE